MYPNKSEVCDTNICSPFGYSSRDSDREVLIWLQKRLVRIIAGVIRARVERTPQYLAWGQTRAWGTRINANSN